jgi:hypothetical protein
MALIPAANPPIPPQLPVPVPKTPWNMSQRLFERIQNQPSDPQSPFKSCEVLSTDPEAAFVIQYFMHNKPHQYGIKKITCIHNPDQTQAFEGTVKIIERETENPAYTPKGKEEEPKQERAQALQRWKECTTQFSPIKIKGLKRADYFSEVKVLPLWHGSTRAVCESIASTGFTSFGKHQYFHSSAQQGANLSTDIGYFGSGIYFTNSARYATLYSNGHLLLAWVSMREPYPVVNDVPHPTKGSDMKKLEGLGHYLNYNAHYIPVASTKPHKPDCMEYYPCYRNQIPTCDEIVVFDKSQTLSRFWIELALDSPGNPLPSPGVSKPASQPLKPAAASLPPYSVAKALPPTSKTTTQTTTTPSAASQPTPVPQISKPVAVPQPSIAFGAADWRKHFGDVGVEPPLPPDIEQILNGPCPIWPGKTLRETHLLVLIPERVNGQPLTLKLLGELVQKPLQGNATKYSHFNIGEYKDPPAPASHWALVTRDVLPNSRNKPYAEQQKIPQGYAGYQVPTILDAATAMFMEYIRSGTRLYGDSPWTYTRCQEKHNKDWQLLVGGFSAAGLVVNVKWPDDYERYGVGGLRKSPTLAAKILNLFH